MTFIVEKIPEKILTSPSYAFLVPKHRLGTRKAQKLMDVTSILYESSNDRKWRMAA